MISVCSPLGSNLSLASGCQEKAFVVSQVQDFQHLCGSEFFKSLSESTRQTFVRHEMCSSGLTGQASREPLHRVFFSCVQAQSCQSRSFSLCGQLSLRSLNSQHFSAIVVFTFTSQVLQVKLCHTMDLPHPLFHLTINLQTFTFQCGRYFVATSRSRFKA